MTESGSRINDGPDQDNLPARFKRPFHDLAQWAFGPEGFASLQLIAYGDFSYDGRYAQNNLFLGRNVGELRYKVYRHEELMGNNLRDFWSDDERRFNKLIEKHSEMLSACPIDSILEI
jgi:hypothetical protein